MENFLDDCCLQVQCVFVEPSPFRTILRLILSGDVESNPGPLDSGTYRTMIIYLISCCFIGDLDYNAEIEEILSSVSDTIFGERHCKPYLSVYAY